MSEKKLAHSERVLKIKAAMAAVGTIDTGTGVATTGDTNVFNQCLPTGHTPDTVKELKLYEQDFVAAGVGFVSEKALEAMATNPELKRATGTFAMGHEDTVTVDFVGERAFSTKFDKNAPPKEGIKYGSTSIVLTNSCGTNTGAIATARKLASMAAQEMLGKATAEAK